jgi:hypothetical protein
VHRFAGRARKDNITGKPRPAAPLYRIAETGLLQAIDPRHRLSAPRCGSFQGRVRLWLSLTRGCVLFCLCIPPGSQCAVGEQWPHNVRSSTKTTPLAHRILDTCTSHCVLLHNPKIADTRHREASSEDGVCSTQGPCKRHRVPSRAAHTTRAGNSSSLPGRKG